MPDVRDDLHKQLDSLTVEAEAAHENCQAAYIAWSNAAAALNSVIRQRDEVWGKLLDTIVEGHHRCK